MKLAANSELGRYDWVPSLLSPLLAGCPTKLVLDIGAGDGMMKAPIEAAGGSYRGFDLAPRHAGIERWDLDDPPDKSWPLAGGAILMDVIEHCNNPGIALRHVAEALEPGGFLMLTMPNPRWSRSRLYALAYGTPICFTQRDLDCNHHVFTPWPHILERLLRDAGFVVTRRDTLDGTTAWPSGPVTVRYPLRLLLAVAMKLIEFLDPSACGLSYGVVAQKHPASAASATSGDH